MNKTASVQRIEGNKGASEQRAINWQYVLQGWLTGLAFLAMLAFWGTFAYSMWSGDVKLAMTFGKIIAVMVGVAVPVMILQHLYRAITRS